MINQQLVDYIKQQLQLGVSKEGIKNTLITSGWPEADVSEAMASLEPKAAAPAAAPAASQVTSDIFQPKTEFAKTEAAAPAEPAKKSEPVAFEKNIESYADPIASSAMATAHPRGKMLLLAFGTLALILLLAAGYLYMENASLDADVVSANQMNNALSRDHAALVEEKGSLAGQLAALTEENESLHAHLSFLLGSGTTTVKTTIRGTLNGDEKTPYTLVTASGLTVNLRNYRDPRVLPMIQSLLGNGSQLTLEHAPGSRDAVIVAVNGDQVPEEAPAAPPQSTLTTPGQPITP